MKLISQLLVAITVLLSFTVCNAQIKNSVSNPSDSELAKQTVKVFGNCGMCKTTIEKVGSLKNTAKVDWDADTNMATLTYDAKQTNQDAILKRIALAGYDSEKFLAPDKAYSNLPGCCQYEREAKTEVKSEEPKMAMSNTATVAETQKTNQLQPVFDSYFELKDVLVKTDGNSASAKASALLTFINNVKMDKLEIEIHMVWMKILKNLKEDTQSIANTKDVKKQRDHFDTLSLNMYNLIKASKQETPTYLQHCPMANDGKGADWLSKENTIKNPYYCSMMLTCGKTVETIK
jgi:copper chaperone CopZ